MCNKDIKTSGRASITSLSEGAKKREKGITRQGLLCKEGESHVEGTQDSVGCSVKENVELKNDLGIRGRSGATASNSIPKKRREKYFRPKEREVRRRESFGAPSRGTRGGIGLKTSSGKRRLRQSELYNLKPDRKAKNAGNRKELT